MGQGLFFFKQRPYTESVTFPIRVGTNIVDSRCKIVKIKNDHNDYLRLPINRKKKMVTINFLCHP